MKGNKQIITLQKLEQKKNIEENGDPTNMKKNPVQMFREEAGCVAT